MILHVLRGLAAWKAVEYRALIKREVLSRLGDDPCWIDPGLILSE